MPHGARRGALAVLSVTLLAACGSTGSTDESAPAAVPVLTSEVLAVAAAADDVAVELAARAGDERPVLLYSTGDLDTVEALAEGFRAAHPDVGLEYVNLGGASDLIARLEAEAATGARTADVVYGPLSALAGVRSLLATHHGAIIPSGYPARAVDDRALVLIAKPVGVAWNTDLVPEGFDPRDWDDLLEPVHAGCTHTAATSWILALLEGSPGTDLDAWFTSFRANGGVMASSSGAQTRRLASGEIACSASVNLGDVIAAVADGAPLEYRALEPVPMVTHGLGVVDGTASPHGAALLARWIADRDGVETLTWKSDGIPLLEGAPVGRGLEAWADPTDPIWDGTPLLSLDRVVELNPTVLGLIQRHHTPFDVG